MESVCLTSFLFSSVDIFQRFYFTFADSEEKTFIYDGQHHDGLLGFNVTTGKHCLPSKFEFTQRSSSIKNPVRAWYCVSVILFKHATEELYAIAYITRSETLKLKTPAG